jgi:hypothetical protein
MGTVLQPVRIPSTFDWVYDVCGGCKIISGMRGEALVRYGIFGLAICTALDRVAIYPFCTSNVGLHQRWFLHVG